MQVMSRGRGVAWGRGYLSDMVEALAEDKVLLLSLELVVWALAVELPRLWWGLGLPPLGCWFTSIGWRLRLVLESSETGVCGKSMILYKSIIVTVLTHSQQPQTSQCIFTSGYRHADIPPTPKRSLSFTRSTVPFSSHYRELSHTLTHRFKSGPAKWTVPIILST